jgi:superfamily II DNA or RNA helicase
MTDQLTRGWSVGSTIETPALFSSVESVAGNELRQLKSPSDEAKVVSAGSEAITLERGGQTIKCLIKGGGQRGPFLRPKNLLTTNLSSIGPEDLEWAGAPSPDSPGVVIKSLDGAFVLAADTKSASSDGEGFRTPQIGAVHAVLSHWTTESTKAGTVVLPTGTGKTETMLALFASRPLDRLLVIVPSSALRKQIAEKFETLGMLPTIGALRGNYHYPVVGRVEHYFTSRTGAERFAKKCNVVVTTPQALQIDEAVKAAFLKQFTHLFVDEAHHVAAATWQSIVQGFDGKPIVQFTATPYREDRQSIGGSLLYRFPLRLAKQQGYFAGLRYRAIRAPGRVDLSISEAAVEQLGQDLNEGLDHIVMARVSTKARAKDVVQIYQQLAPQYEPVRLDSDLTAEEQRKALAAVRTRASRVIVCVDMLGEGFDLPALKIAAIHDPHKSLGITLQFIGRFARVERKLGDATMIVERPNTLHDERLRALYREDADWESLVENLSEETSQRYEEWTEFEKGFAGADTSISVADLRVKMSTVVYKTEADEWHPERLEEYFGTDTLVVTPQVHEAQHVCWLIRQLEAPTDWDARSQLLDTAHELFVLYWDQSTGLLYIHGSNTEGPDKHYQRVAKVVVGEKVRRITGDEVFRVYSDVARPTPTNIGTLDTQNWDARFLMYAGRNVEAGFTEAQKQTKYRTNLFAHGYVAGDSRSIGVSTKGRIWEWRAGGNIGEWISWCRRVGELVTDEAIDLEQVMGNFIIPEQLAKRPDLVPLAVEWPIDVYLRVAENLRTSYQGTEYAVADTALKVNTHSRTGPIDISLVTDDWQTDYRLGFTAEGMRVEALSIGEADIVSQSGSQSFSEFVDKDGITLLLEGEAVIEYPGELYKPRRDSDPFPRDDVRSDVDWSMSDITHETKQVGEKLSVQESFLQHMMGGSWDLIIVDDGSNEVADLVGIEVREGDLALQLVHCKASSKKDPGSRVEDLYEVCGQAMKCVHRRRNVMATLGHLRRRAQNRLKDGRHDGVRSGLLADLDRIVDEAALLRPEFEVVIVQPGLSRAKASRPLLELLGATETYVKDAGGSRLRVYGSE